MKSLSMNVEEFVRWVLDDSRTTEELYTTELVVEQALTSWGFKHKQPMQMDFEAKMERKRQRKLNPAHRPTFTEQNLRNATEMFPNLRSLSWFCGFDDRQIRDLKVLRFLPALEQFHLHRSEVADISPLTEVRPLRELLFSSLLCEDYGPLARCADLNTLNLEFLVHWPEVAGLENLKQLRSLSLKGNLLAFERGVSWENVRQGALECSPLAARNVRDLPQLPGCEILTLGGVDRLDGIEAFPNVRNLTLNGPVRDFSPLQALQGLTCFQCNAAQPLDISPLVRLPKLYFVGFETKHDFGIDKGTPRDFSALIEAPQLRELEVKGCRPVKTEVAGLNAGLPPWDDLFLLPEPRPLPKLRIIVAPYTRINRLTVAASSSEEQVNDPGLLKCENKWVVKFVTKAINKRLKCKDWGKVEAIGQRRGFTVHVESFSVVEKLSDILEGTRTAMASLRSEYDAHIWISLKAPQREPTAAEKELEERFQREREDAEFERRQAEQQEYLERLHRYELKKQEGGEIDPKEFAAPAPKPLPPAPWERDDEEEEDPHSGDVVVKKKPEPPPSWFDDEHPLADNYRTMARLTLKEAWFINRDQGLVAYLTGRPPDEVLPDEPEGQS